MVAASLMVDEVAGMIAATPVVNVAAALAGRHDGSVG